MVLRPSTRPNTSGLRVPVSPSSQEESIGVRTSQLPINDGTLITPKPDLGLGKPTSAPQPYKSALLPFSLRGEADELDRLATASVPLPCGFIRMGQATMIYAAPSTGKTLITLRVLYDAVVEKVIDPERLFYINADDNGEGLVTKVKLFQDCGAHMMAVGHKGLKQDLAPLLGADIENGSAAGTVVVIDTLKKFANLMDKKNSTEFSQVCRQFTVAGGTIIALGHTTKHSNEDGTPRYQGTTDILEDFDAVYVGQAISSKMEGLKGIKLTKLKSRGFSPEVVAYGFSDEDDCSYDAKFASVQALDPQFIDLDDLTDRNRDDEFFVENIKMAITYQGHMGKMFIAKVAATPSGCSVKTIVKLIERYEGQDPDLHLWHYKVGEHGKRTYFLHTPI